MAKAKKNSAPNEKRASLPKMTGRSAEFKKSWERYDRAGRHDMKALREVMAMLFYGDRLPSEYLDHELAGEWAGYRECHIGGDFLLIYRLSSTDVYFVDIGTHAELFK